MHVYSEDSCPVRLTSRNLCIRLELKQKAFYCLWNSTKFGVVVILHKGCFEDYFCYFSVTKNSDLVGLLEALIATFIHKAHFVSGPHLTEWIMSLKTSPLARYLTGISVLLMESPGLGPSIWTKGLLMATRSVWQCICGKGTPPQNLLKDWGWAQLQWFFKGCSSSMQLQ